MAGEYDVTDIPFEDTTAAKEISKSVLSPDYRAPRGAFGGQELGGLVGGLGFGTLGGIVAGPPGAFAGSTFGAGVGGMVGEAVEQYTRKEEPSLSLVAKAGVEEAAWDLGGNLVLKGAGKVLRFGADKIGFSQKDFPDANKAAEAFLEKQGSSLPLGARTGSNFLTNLESFVYSPATFGLFKEKQQEIGDALRAGSKDVLKSLAKSPELEQALRSNTSSQYASGEILQNFIKQGQESLGNSVRPIYDEIFKDKKSLISTFPLNSWASAQLTKPASLTSGQQTILNEIKNLPPNVDMQYMHEIRSRWLAENRDKYASNTASQKDLRASKTITNLIDKIDNAMDVSAKSTLDPSTYQQYQKVTNTYREGVQGLQSDAIVEALRLYPEEVGGHLFRSGLETPTLDLFKAVSAVGTIKKAEIDGLKEQLQTLEKSGVGKGSFDYKSLATQIKKLESKDSTQEASNLMDALRHGYLEAMVNTPENMLKFANNLEQNKAMANTYNRLFDGTPQDTAIKAMNNAAKLGLVDTKAVAGVPYQTMRPLLTGAGQLATIGTGYYFLLSPEQQNTIKDNLGSAAIVGGGLFFSQRNLAKVLLDPKGARSLTYLSTAKEKLTSPTAFTKLVVEPIVNILGGSGASEEFFPKGRSEFDVSDIPIK